MTTDELENLAKEHFKTAPKDPAQWFSAARTHRAGAEATYKLINDLCPDFFDCTELAQENSETYLTVHGLAIQHRLACGYAIENALKGLAVGLGKVTVHKANGELSQDILTHDLLRLARKANLALDEYEQYLLQTLHDDITWAKYPFPKSYKAQIRTEKVQKSFSVNSEKSERDLKIFHSSDQDVSSWIWRLFDKIVSNVA